MTSARQLMTKTKHKEAVWIEGTELQEYCEYPVIANSKGAEKVMILFKAKFTLDATVTVSPAHIKQGFKWLGRWEVISPFRPYRELAIDLVKGRAEEEIRALGLGDLRVPTFDPRLIFLLKNARTERLMAKYRKLQADWDPRIAFLAAVWETKPLIKPLPAGRWIR